MKRPTWEEWQLQLMREAIDRQTEVHAAQAKYEESMRVLHETMDRGKETYEGQEASEDGDNADRVEP